MLQLLIAAILEQINSDLGELHLLYADEVCAVIDIRTQSPKSITFHLEHPNYPHPIEKTFTDAQELLKAVVGGTLH